ncbi:hypothetical protein IUY40_16300 [Flavobacterium sp. ALJ2]|uniref:hypothetical protein n=1 Tax=Flavobacterium sp. ALJ2 TaxID=2786960 RepID=UPI00189E7DE7|nr:hypothetical protein [Flavobacterium sp. ALJ2]MBF7093094.1 hypothetical protein [Flavobacterium sp. ALJ2]
MIQCVKHGLYGIAINIENSICEKINKNQELFSSNLSVVEVYLYDGEEYLYNLNYIITNETKKSIILNQYIKFIMKKMKNN